MIELYDTEKVQHQSDTAIMTDMVRLGKENESLRADKERLDWLNQHCDGIDIQGSGAADDKWWIIIYNDGNRAEGAPLRQAIDAAKAKP